MLCEKCGGTGLPFQLFSGPQDLGRWPREAGDPASAWNLPLRREMLLLMSSIRLGCFLSIRLAVLITLSTALCVGSHP